VKLSGDDAIQMKTGNFTRYQPFSISLSMNTPDKKERAVIFHRSRAWTDAASRGYQLLIEDGKLSASLIHFWPGNAIRVKTKQEIPLNQWIDVSVVYDGSVDAAGLSIFIDGQAMELEVVKNKLTRNITGGGGNNIAIGQRFRDRGFTNGLVSSFKVYDRQLSSLEVARRSKSMRTRKKDIWEG
ncbi:LamG domain-containing protein, partial [bacterium]|nr:LamG domain-containing protein [bacterium]